jgi:hypothetical protein
MAGWPVSVPRHDIHATSMISCAGETFAVRDDTTAVQTGALLRWVADAGLYDEIAWQWKPIQNQTGAQVVWETSVEYAPTLIEEYSYRVQDERFLMTALNFDSDTKNHMWADFTTTIGGASGYTVIMVMSPNSTFGNNLDVPFNGLWCPGRATPATDVFPETVDDTWSAVTMQGRYLYLETETEGPKRGISIDPALNSSAPLYLAIVFGRPETVFYAGAGPDSMRVKTLTTNDNVGLMDNGVVLGRSTGDVLHTADMALFDLAVYADRLTASEVRAEFALLSGAYGGSE